MRVHDLLTLQRLGLGLLVRLRRRRLRARRLRKLSLRGHRPRESAVYRRQRRYVIAALAP